jgi:hypothetical protein
VKETFTGGRTSVAPRARADRPRDASFARAGAGGVSTGRSMCRASRYPRAMPAGSSRIARGQRGSSKTRGSAGSETLAFTSDVPPRPHPRKTPMSSHTRRS